MSADEGLELAAGAVVVPGVVSLAASTRRTLKHGDSFAMFDEYGDVTEVEHSPGGLFFCDTRFLSRLRFTMEGHRPLVLSSTVQIDNLTLDVDLTNPDIFRDERLALGKDTFHVARTAFLWDASCYQLFTVTNYDDQPRTLRLAIEFDADFADLFEIRGRHRHHRGKVTAERRGRSETAFVYHSLDGVPRATVLCFEPVPASLEDGAANFEIQVGARERRSIGMTAHCVQGGHAAPSEKRFFTVMRRARRSHAAARAQRARVESSNPTVNSVLSRSIADLGMLTTEKPEGPYPYAGVPWYATVFGRDGIITALEMLWFDPSPARGVLRFLAAHQATREDPKSDAEPGKILHEMREDELAHLGDVPFGRYYGTVDATPLFVALAGLYWQRTHDRSTIEAIWPAVQAALEWIDRYGDRDGDGFIEYGPQRESGLRNQGWKDSDDAIFHADGRIAQPPIALCEVQGYVYLARRMAALLAADLGDRRLAGKLEAQAAHLRARFAEAFWCESIDSFALALDGDKNPCAVRSSNAGQLLFTGIAHEEHAARVAGQLLRREFYTGWGLRTLSSREKRFNPTSYHNGSVWPHDNALIALGLGEYGLASQVMAVTDAIFDAAGHMHLRRLPELFCGFERRRGKAPTLYPVACAPQAWAACAPFALLQACLGLQVDAGADTLILRRPSLPQSIEWLRVRGLRVGEGRLDLMFRRHDSTVAVNLLDREGDAEVEIVL